MDQDFSIDYRTSFLMGWLEELEMACEEHFDKFTSLARKQESGHSQSLVGPRTGTDVFEGEQVTASSIFEFEK